MKSIYRISQPAQAGVNRRLRPILAATLVLTVGSLCQSAWAWPWSRDMADYIAIKPQARPMAFPKRSVPVPETAVVHVADKETAAKLANPIPLTADSVRKGHEMFNIYCTPCHGTSGTGDGLVGEKLVLRPFDLTSASVQQISDGLIFGYITFGGAVMPIYGNDLTPTERWNVVNYVRNAFQHKPLVASAEPARKETK